MLWVSARTALEPRNLVELQSRLRSRMTVKACHLAPFGVAMPRRLSSSAALFADRPASSARIGRNSLARPETAPQRRQDDGRLSLLPILTERKVGPSRFPCDWRQVANRSRLATGSVGRLASVHKVLFNGFLVHQCSSNARPHTGTNVRLTSSKGTEGTVRR